MKTFLVFLLMSMGQALADPATLTCAFDGEQNVLVYPHPTSPGKLHVRFSFKRANYPSGMGVLPGTCAWPDRNVYQDEPTIVMAVVDEVYRYVEVNYRGGRHLVLVPAGATWAPLSLIRGAKVIFKVEASPASEGLNVPFFRVISAQKHPRIKALPRE